MVNPMCVRDENTVCKSNVSASRNSLSLSSAPLLFLFLKMMTSQTDKRAKKKGKAPNGDYFKHLGNWDQISIFYSLSKFYKF